MQLKGWSKPLPPWLVEAIENGEVLVYLDEKNQIELLKGSVVNPFGIKVTFA